MPAYTSLRAPSVARSERGVRRHELDLIFPGLLASDIDRDARPGPTAIGDRELHACDAVLQVDRLSLPPEGEAQVLVRPSKVTRANLSLCSLTVQCSALNRTPLKLLVDSASSRSVEAMLVASYGASGNSE